MPFTVRRAAVAATALASAAALGLGLLPPTATAAQRSLHTPARQAADQALAAVERAVHPAERAARHPSRDLTLLLTRLAVHKKALSPSDQRVAQRYLARPTDPGGDDLGDVTVNYGNRDVQTVCSTNVCVNWVESGAHSPSLEDYDTDGTPDYVETVRDTMQHVWDVEVGSFGYRAPLPDAKGINSKLDVYLGDIGDAGYYGYCVPESANGPGWDYDGYCVLDNDFAADEFPTNTPTENLQVTAAHEFFHAIQFSYDAAEDAWFMEGTAAWMEDEVYDAVNDNYQYLRSSPISNPGRPLDHSASIGVYGSWIWWRFLGESLGSDVVRKIWQRADDATDVDGEHYSMQAVDRELKSRSEDLGAAFADFNAVNRQPRSFYEEGNAYPHSRARVGFTLRNGKKSTGAKAFTLDHMSAGTVTVKRGALSGSAWKLRVNVNGPDRVHQPRAVVTSYDSTGAMSRGVNIALNRRGVGTKKVAFGPGVTRVDVTLVDAGRRYACWRGTQYSCQGRPKDDNQKFHYQLTAVR